MAKATIKSKSGAVITVEGTEREVAKIVAIVEGGATGEHGKKLPPEARYLGRPHRKRGAASDLVLELKEEGFFDKPKGLTEISKGLEEKGYIYPVTTLSGVVLSLLHRRVLGRKKVEGRWVYGK